MVVFTIRKEFGLKDNMVLDCQSWTWGWQEGCMCEEMYIAGMQTMFFRMAICNRSLVLADRLVPGSTGIKIVTGKGKLNSWD